MSLYLKSLKKAMKRVWRYERGIIMKRIVTGFVLLTILAGCSNEEDKVVVAGNKEVDSIVQEETDFFKKFENELSGKYTIIEEVTMAAEMVGAIEGHKYVVADDNSAEIYLFDEESDTYKAAKETGKLRLDGFGQFDIIMNGLYGIVKENASDDVIDIFKSIE